MSWIILSIIIFNHFSFIHFEDGKKFFPIYRELNWQWISFYWNSFWRSESFSFTLMTFYCLECSSMVFQVENLIPPWVARAQKKVSKFFSQSDKKRKRRILSTWYLLLFLYWHYWLLILCQIIFINWEY